MWSCSAAEIRLLSEPAHLLQVADKQRQFARSGAGFPRLAKKPL
jgi:hypothetical protein